MSIGVKRTEFTRFVGRQADQAAADGSRLPMREAILVWVGLSVVLWSIILGAILS